MAFLSTLSLLGALPLLDSPQEPGEWTLRYSFDGPVEYGYLGAALAQVGDINADGIADIGAGHSPVVGPGRVYMISGADGRRIYEVGPGRGNVTTISALAELNGDGYDEFLVSTWDTVRRVVFLHSGVDGTVLLQVTDPQDQSGEDFGDALAPTADFDGDGWPDFAVGMPRWDEGGTPDRGRVDIYSSADGAQLLRFDGPPGEISMFGDALASGDVNGDGIQDLIVGAPLAHVGGTTSGGSVFLYSGADGSLLRRIDGPVYNNLAVGAFGLTIAVCGDLDGNGGADIAVADARARGPAGRNAGAVYIHSGEDGSLLKVLLSSEDLSAFGEAVASGGDANGDGIPDILVGAPEAILGSWQDTGQAFVYSGADASLLYSVYGETARDGFGSAVAFGGDGDGDGTDDIVVSAPVADPGALSWAGSVYAFGYNPFLWAGDGEVSIAAHDTVVLNLDFPDSAAGESWMLLLSATGQGPVTRQGLTLPLTPDALLQRTLAGDYSMLGAGSQGMTGVLDPDGDGQILLDFPPGAPPVAPGSRFYAAVLTLDAFGQPAHVSASVTLTVVP